MMIFTIHPKHITNAEIAVKHLLDQSSARIKAGLLE